MMSGWGFPHLNAPQRFEEQYHVYSAAYADRSNLEHGDKILLPPSAFDTLARLNVDYPMLFSLTCGSYKTHCGVLEFTAEEGSCYIPFWMMKNLRVEEGSLISVTNVSLQKATALKLQPQQLDFLDISNPRAVLEHALRNFSCVTKDDIICVPYNNKSYEFKMVDVKPENAVCIIECDCNVDFEAPPGYQEPTNNNNNRQNKGDQEEKKSDENNENEDSSDKKTSEEDNSKFKIRIDKDGKIIRPEDIGISESEINREKWKSTEKFVASRTGATGVQSNAAVPRDAPTVDYWALKAGNGCQRLDGKKPAVLKTKDGEEVDVKKLRAEAAERRLKAMQQEADQKFSSVEKSQKSNDGDGIESEKKSSKRNSRVGKKYSRQNKKGSVSAFQGSGNTF